MKKLLLILSVLIFAFFGCKKAERLEANLVELSEEIIAIGIDNVVISASYSYKYELKSATIFYSENEDLNNSQTDTVIITNDSIKVTLRDLKPKTWYYYQFKFYNGVNYMTTEVKSFKTLFKDALPTVITGMVTDIGPTTALCSGEVVSDGNLPVTKRGVCWCFHPQPVIEDDSHTIEGQGVGEYESFMEYLLPNTTYYVRAYASNSKGTSYGEDRMFNTKENLPEGPEGAINALFSVNEDGDKVYFSKGNLQYQATTNTWRFAEKQWDFVGSTEDLNQGPAGTIVGSSNHLISPTYKGWIDLFGWGTSGYNHGSVCYQPWSATVYVSDYVAYGFINNDLSDETGKADWGYNAISNGGNVENMWRTLSMGEWSYLLETRNTSSGMRYAKAIVNDIQGIILFPDDWNSVVYEFNSVNTANASYSDNIISMSLWVSTFETNGAVFLPGAGSRYLTTCDFSDHNGLYWSSTHLDGACAYGVHFNESDMTCTMNILRDQGVSVRLVQNADRTAQ